MPHAKRALQVLPVVPCDDDDTLEPLLTCDEVGAILKRSRDAVRMMVLRGQLPGYRLGGKGLRFKRKDIATYLENLPRV